MLWIYLADECDKENISINTTKKPRCQCRTSGLQCSFYECQNGYFCADGKRSMFHFFRVPLKNPQKTIWCNKLGKVEGKDGFRVTKNTKVCHAHFNNEDVLKVPGGSRWNLREDAKAIKDLIIWQAPRAGSMRRILCSDWLPERATWSDTARPGLPVSFPQIKLRQS